MNPNPAGVALPAFAPEFLERLVRLRFHSGRLGGAATEGEHPSRAVGRTPDFLGHRPYVPGDEVRTIDWNAFARTGRLVVKEFLAEENLEVDLLVDTTPSMDFGTPTKRSWASRLAAALGFLALHLRHPVRIGAGGSATAGPFVGPGAVPDLFRAAESLVSAPGPWRGPESVREGRRALHVLISDLWEAGPVQSALAARTRGGAGIVLMHLLAPEETDPPLEGWQKLADAETGRTLERYVGEEERAAYRRALDGIREDWSRFAARLGIKYWPCTTAVTVEDFVTIGLREAGVLS